MSKKFKSTSSMYKSKSRDRRRRGASVGCMTMISGLLLLITSIIALIF